jgi:hypothetical protein
MTSLADILARPPSYYLSEPMSLPSSPPDYHPHPISGERRIQASLLGRPRPTGTYRKQFGNVTLFLTEQPEDASVPSYSNGSESQVNGVIAFDNPKSREVVSEVYVMVCINLNLFIRT